MFFAIGLALLGLGLVAGALLLLLPLGLVPGAASLTLWILFPLFVVGGYLMAASAAAGRTVAVLTKGSGAVLGLLALAAAVVLMLQAAAVIQPEGSMLSVWYVMGLGIVLGGTGIASYDRKATI